jgi:hypothetical protein
VFRNVFETRRDLLSSADPGGRESKRSPILGPVILVVAGVLGALSHGSPRARDASAPLSEFSAHRARRLIETIAAEPHPAGTPEAARVREFLVEELRRLGLEPVTQVAGHLDDERVVVNVIANQQGVKSGDRDALLVMAHYDSRPGGSKGASDDGSGVAAILESLRALRDTGEQLDRDLIVLLTDGEELGLLGAKAFVDRHPWAERVGLALNFEARGTRGPSFLFQTSAGNHELIAEFARAVPQPVGTSLAGAVYRALPNDTDLSPFLARGIAGLNFAFIDGLEYYHTPDDDLEHLSLDSLQHQGEYVLGCMRAFGKARDEPTHEADAVYFPFPAPVGRLVVYPMSWALPFAIVVAFLALAVIGNGIRTGAVSLVRAALAFGIGVSALVVAPVVAWLAWNGLAAANQRHTWASNVWLFELAAVALAVAIPLALAGSTGRSLRAIDWSVGTVLLLVIASVVVTVVLPGGSYLFTWPALGLLAGLAMVIHLHPFRDVHLSPSIPLALGAIPAVALWVPTIHGLSMAFSLIMPHLFVLSACWLVVLLLPNLTPHLRTGRLPRCAFVTFATCFLLGAAIPDPDAVRAIAGKGYYRPQWPAAHGHGHGQVESSVSSTAASSDPPRVAGPGSHKAAFMDP